jgi:hypothetical protein
VLPLTPLSVRALLTRDVTPAVSERERLVALLGALAEPARAADLPADDPVLVTVARHHRLSPLLSATCGNSLPVRLGELFRRDRLVTAARGMILAQVAEECVTAFNEAGIRTIVLKGLDYEARLYDRAGVRPTSDLDLLVENEKRRAAFAVLDRLGFEPRAAAPGFDDSDYHEVAWNRSGVEVDLHMALAPLARCRIDYEAVWNAAEPWRVGQSDAWRLASVHAAIFHALHMAIDHFDVPAIYLVDLARLLPGVDDLKAADATARLWRCHRPFVTARTLAATFLPAWAADQSAADGRGGQLGTPTIAARVVQRYGSTTPVPRGEQLFRKLLHFDTVVDAARYVAVQSRRNVEERLERATSGRTARQRLGL